MSELLGLSKLQAGTVLRSTARHIGNVCRDGMVDWKSKPNRTATIQLIEGLLVLPRCWPARGSLASHSVAPPRTFLVVVLLYRLQEVLKNLADDQARSMLWQRHGLMMIYDAYYDICIVL